MTDIYKHNYWVWRHNDTKEIACLVRNSHPVPFSACAEQVHAALGFEYEVVESLTMSCFDKISLYSDYDFTLSQWETWFAFEMCPAITVYVKETRTRHDIIVWGWERIKS